MQIFLTHTPEVNERVWVAGVHDDFSEEQTWCSDDGLVNSNMKAITGKSNISELLTFKEIIVKFILCRSSKYRLNCLKSKSSWYNKVWFKILLLELGFYKFFLCNVFQWTMTECQTEI